MKVQNLGLGLKSRRRGRIGTGLKFPINSGGHPNDWALHGIQRGGTQGNPPLLIQGSDPWTWEWLHAGPCVVWQLCGGAAEERGDGAGGGLWQRHHLLQRHRGLHLHVGWEHATTGNTKTPPRVPLRSPRLCSAAGFTALRLGVWIKDSRFKGCFFCHTGCAVKCLCDLLFFCA